MVVGMPLQLFTKSQRSKVTKKESKAIETGSQLNDFTSSAIGPLRDGVQYQVTIMSPSLT